MRKTFFCRALIWSLLAVAALLVPKHANAAGGAYVVDDSEIDDPGKCKLQVWTQFASNHDFNTVANPACVVKLGIPIEIDALVQRSRDDDVWGTSGGTIAKINLISTAKSPIGVGLEGIINWDFMTGAYTGGTVFVPVTFQISDTFHINVNGGLLNDNVNKINYAYWGAGFEWIFYKPFTLIGEVFGQLGALPAVDPGDPAPPNSIREPRTQIGIRYTPKDSIDFDVIWGHNITGENANWITLGVNVRF